MTRPKVDPDKRIRTAIACDSCKRRKQKCDGKQPCATCTKRSLSCDYIDDNNPDTREASPKRRMGIKSGSGNSKDDSASSAPPVRRGDKTIWQRRSSKNSVSSSNVAEPSQHGVPNQMSARGGSIDDDTPDGSAEMANSSPVSNLASTPHEEAVLYRHARMLHDSNGKLVYVGDSAALSFLQCIRMVVEGVSGPSNFTEDPMRHMIVEHNVALPPNVRFTPLIPEAQTAHILIDSYFTNMNGLIEVCDAKTFKHILDRCYTDPLSVDPDWVCLFFLICAIGLVMASPAPGSQEEIIIMKLRANQSVDQAELFFANAKHFKDPVACFEESGLWNIQALILMTVYALAVSRRDAAYKYHGMAVHSAFALGLHREDAMGWFGGVEQSIRRNLWRSLFVLDRFLSTSLGRPTAIREDDCSGTALMTGERAPFPQAPFPTAANATYTGPNAVGLEASVRSCHAIGVILERVYSQGKISTKLAQEIANNCQGWAKALDPSLNHRQARSASPSQGMAILHVNLLNCHSVILLTRPFLVFLMFKKYTSPAEPSPRAQASRMEKFAGACVVASTSSIALVESAKECGYLSRTNPFVLYFLFAASLVILSNEFCCLCQNPDANTSLTQAIDSMQFFAQQDPQASYLLEILISFHKAVLHQQSVQVQQQGIARVDGCISPLGPGIVDDHIEVMAKMFQGDAPSLNSNAVYSSARPRLPADSQQVSFPPEISSASPFPVSNDFAVRRHSSQGSMDPFLYLAQISSRANSGAFNDVSDTENNADIEIDFETLWQFPPHNSGGTTPGMISGEASADMVEEPHSFMNDLQGSGDGHAPQFEFDALHPMT